MCLFCKIASKQVPAKVAFEDDDVLVFHDINPHAPTHLLVIPKVHVPSLVAAQPEHQALLGKLLITASHVAEQAGLNESGFRVVVNTGPDAGQSVFHVHLHVLGGRSMAWPPG